MLDVEESLLKRRAYSDQRRLEQILLNLMSNSIKFTFRGSITFRITPEGETGLKFEVEDTGVGISESSLPNLFKLFGKLQESESINTTGCGIGLHISQQLVGKLGGQIEVKSRLNEGSNFSFVLPECLEAELTEDVMETFRDDDEILTSSRGINNVPL